VELDVLADRETDVAVLDAFVLRRELLDDRALRVAAQHALVGVEHHDVGRRFAVVVRVEPGRHLPLRDPHLELLLRVVVVVVSVVSAAHAPGDRDGRGGATGGL